MTASSEAHVNLETVFCYTWLYSFGDTNKKNLSQTEALVGPVKQIKLSEIFHP